MTDLARLKVLLERCTQGPWQRSGTRYKVREDSFGIGPDGFAIAFVPIGRNDGSELGNKQHTDAFNDAELISITPTVARDLLALSEENARLSASVAVLERELADEEGVNRILVGGLGDRNGRLQEIARLASQAIADGGAVTVLGRIAGLATLANGDSIAALEGKQP